jgi:nonsense-mediated mRNA decay protein 3
MSTGEFCVLCGRTGRELTDGVCADCAAAREPLLRVPAQVEIVVCPQCGARFHRGQWGGAGGSAVLTAEDLAPFLEPHPDVAVRSVRWEERAHSRSLRELTGEARVRFRGIERTVPLELTARVVGRTCTDCGRRSGRYYTALLQLRGDADPRTRRPKELRRRLEAVWADLVHESRGDWKAAVGWREELPEGWDVYFTDTLAARSVARLAKQQFGAKLTESASLFGRKNGQDVYRVTFCLRFPAALLAAADRTPAAPPESDLER